MKIEAERAGLVRPGQWGDKARKRRSRRLERAAERRAVEWMRRAGRHGRRLIERVALVRAVRERGIEPKPGEFTKALRYRLRCAMTVPTFTRRGLELLTGGKVAPSTATGEVVVTLPAGTSPERVAEVEALCLDYVPVHVVAVVRVEGV